MKNGVFGENLPTRYLDVPGGKIAFDDTGETDRPVIIAAAGMGEMREQFRYVRPELQKAGYRVVTVDQRGHGESSIDWKDYTVRSSGKDILALIDKLGITSATVMGNSYGGGSAIWAAHDAPEKVNSLVLLDPVTKSGDMPALVKGFYNALLATPIAGVNGWISHWDKLFTSQKPADHDAYKQALKDNLKEPGRMKAFRGLMMDDNNAHLALDSIKVPTLLIMGEKDGDFKNPTQEAHETGERLGAQVHVLEAVGHYPHVETPKEVLAKVVPFLDKIHAMEHGPNAELAAPSKRWEATAERQRSSQTR